MMESGSRTHFPHVFCTFTVCFVRHLFRYVFFMDRCTLYQRRHPRGACKVVVIQKFPAHVHFTSHTPHVLLLSLHRYSRWRIQTECSASVLYVRSTEQRDWTVQECLCHALPGDAMRRAMNKDLQELQRKPFREVNLL